MLTLIIKNLINRPGLKATDLATMLRSTRKEINQILHGRPDLFVQNTETFAWSVHDDAYCEFSINLSKTWCTQQDFEKALLEQGSPLDSDLNKVVIKITGEQRLLFCAAARLLALSNQLIHANKEVVLDFTGNDSTLSYLSRACFFARLAPEIVVRPIRPDISASEAHKANNIALVELLEIGTRENVPERIKNSFIDAFGKTNATKLFTLVSEMVCNVEDHSETSIPGFAGLQCYTQKAKRSVIVVISDSGKGICTTLRPGLIEHFPEIAKKFPANDKDSDPKLIMHAMENRGLSRMGAGRGAGLHTSREKAQMLNAKITVRQENFSVHLNYKDGELENKTWQLDLPKLIGTHIVFEFSLTTLTNSD